eukprot:3138094-Rhodomonas_salina.1
MYTRYAHTLYQGAHGLREGYAHVGLPDDEEEVGENAEEREHLEAAHAATSNARNQTQVSGANCADVARSCRGLGWGRRGWTPRSESVEQFGIAKAWRIGECVLMGHWGWPG